MRKVLGVLLAGVLVVGLATVAVAQEAPEGDAKAAPKRAPGEVLKRARLLGFRILHGDSVAMKQDGSTVDVRHQKGTIEAVSATSITLKSRDGYTQTYAVNGETIVREKREESTIGELKAGEMAGVVAVKSGGGYTARLINCVGEPKAAPKAAT